MANTLHFFVRIASAFTAPNPRAALRATFRECSGAEGSATGGGSHEAFLRFMAEVQRQLLPDAWILRRPDGSAEVIHISIGAEGTRVTGLRPGVYSLHLRTGRLLWEGVLDAKDLRLPERKLFEPLRMAADTESTGQVPTRELSLLGGAIVVRVYAGTASGSLEIVVPLEG